MKRLGLVLLTCIAAFSAWGQRANYEIIPLPKEVKVDSTQVFTLTDGMAIACDETNQEIARTAQFLRDWVKESTGIQLGQVSDKLTPRALTDAKANVRIRLENTPLKKKDKKAKKPAPELKEQAKESYTITVDKNGIVISALAPAGLFRGAQTLRKSLPLVSAKNQGANGKVVEFPFVTINDQPRFAYRGVLLDCGRHFFSVEFIK